MSEPVYRDAEGRAIAVEVPHDRITLRIASAVRAKLDVFDRYRSRGLVSAGDACIVAVNLRDIPQAWADSKESFFRAVYGMGNRVLVMTPDARQIVSAGREHRIILPRASGAAEEVAPMLDAAHADVCAILGSAADVGNVPDLLGDDFVVMPHAGAQAPSLRGFIGRGVEISLRPGDETGLWTLEETDYGAPEPRGPEKFTVEHEGTFSRASGKLRVGNSMFDLLTAAPLCHSGRAAIQLPRQERSRSRCCAFMGKRAARGFPVPRGTVRHEKP